VDLRELAVTDSSADIDDVDVAEHTVLSVCVGVSVGETQAVEGVDLGSDVVAGEEPVPYP
jgi:fatty acid-binding protein DegV